MSSLCKSLSNISKTLVMVGRCIGKIWMHHRPIRVIFLAISSTWLVTYSSLSAAQRPIGNLLVAHWPIGDPVGFWRADMSSRHFAFKLLVTMTKKWLIKSLTRSSTLSTNKPLMHKTWHEKHASCKNAAEAQVLQPRTSLHHGWRGGGSLLCPLLGPD